MAQSDDAGTPAATPRRVPTFFAPTWANLRYASEPLWRLTISPWIW